MKNYLLLFFLLLSSPLYSQNEEWARFLAIDEINDIVSDPLHIWIATNSGLVQMNPETYEKTFYTKENGLSGDEVKDLLYDSQGRLWAATNEGLSLWRNNEWRTQAIPESFSTRECFSITEDEQGKIRIGMIGQIAVYDGERYEAFKHIRIQGTVGKLFAHDGALWMTLSTGDLWRLKDGQMQLQLPFQENYVSDIGVDIDGNILIASSRFQDSQTPSLMKFDGISWSPVPLPIINQDNPSNAIESGCRDKLLIGTFEGNILEYSRSGIQEVEIQGLDSAYYPRVIHHDPYRNTIWMGTGSIWPSSWPIPRDKFYPVGLYELKSGSSTAKYHHLSQNGFIENDAIIDLLPDEDGGMWIARQRHVYKYKNGNWNRWDFTETVQTMRQDPKGRIWIGTNGGAGLYMIDQQVLYEVWVKENGVLKNLERNSYEGLDIQGDSIFYLGSRVEDVSKCWIEEIQGNQVIIRQERLNIDPQGANRINYVRKIKVTPKGHVWVVADANHIFRFDGNTWMGPVSSELGYITDIVAEGEKVWFTGYSFSRRPGGIAYSSEVDWPNIVPFDRLGCPADQPSTGNLFIKDSTFYTSHIIGISISDKQSACSYISEPFDDQKTGAPGISLDKEDNIWFHTNKNLYTYNPKGLVNIVKNPGMSPPPTNETGTWHCVPDLDVGKWNVYPNPIRYGTWVEKEFTEEVNLEIRVVDFLGRTYKSWDKQVIEAGLLRQYLKLGELPSGNYFLQFITDKETEVVKITLAIP